MDIFGDKTTHELLISVLAEVNKSRNEINSAQADLQKAERRLRFLTALTNHLIERYTNNETQRPSKKTTID